MQGDPVTDAERADMVRRYTVDRQSLQDVADATARAYSTVRRVLLDADVQLAPRGRPRTRHPTCP